MSEMTRENRWRHVVLQTSLATAWLRRPSSHRRCARAAPELPTRGEAPPHARHERPVPGSAAAGCSGGLQLAFRLAPGPASIPVRPYIPISPVAVRFELTTDRSRNCPEVENVSISIHIFLDSGERGQLSRSLAHGCRRPAGRFSAKGLNSQDESNEIIRICYRLAIAGHSRLTPGQFPTRGKICRHPWSSKKCDQVGQLSASSAGIQVLRSSGAERFRLDRTRGRIVWDQRHSA
jgi:hypothetical protein